MANIVCKRWKKILLIKLIVQRSLTPLKAIINYRFLTTEPNLKALYVCISLFVHNLISKAICSECGVFCEQLCFRKKEKRHSQNLSHFEKEPHFENESSFWNPLRAAPEQFSIPPNDLPYFLLTQIWVHLHLMRACVLLNCMWQMEMRVFPGNFSIN